MSRQVQHTPGPWEFRQDEDGTWTIFADGHSFMGDAQYYPWVPSSKADWHLIAAAPELLEALQEYAIPLSGHYKQDIAEFGVDTVEREHRRRAVIAKVKGENNV